jgi:hypothetical protein
MAPRVIPIVLSAMLTSVSLGWAGLPIPEETTTSTTEATTTSTTETTEPPPLETTTTLVETTTTTLAERVTTTTTLAPPVGCDPTRPGDCDDGDPCTRDSCGGAFLTCEHIPLDGTPCPDDGVFCTVDRCKEGVCTHRLSDRRCDRGECVIRACRPGERHADHHGCVLVKGKDKRDGVPCTDDGFGCTDDVCMHGGCMHMPMDTRCVPTGMCTAGACDPSMSDHDEAGCAHGPPRSEGRCAEDADACARRLRRRLRAPAGDRLRRATGQDVFRRRSLSRPSPPS